MLDSLIDARSSSVYNERMFLRMREERAGRCCEWRYDCMNICESGRCPRPAAKDAGTSVDYTRIVLQATIDVTPASPAVCLSLGPPTLAIVLRGRLGGVFITNY